MDMNDKENQRRVLEWKRVCPKCYKEFKYLECENKDSRAGGYKCPHCGKIFHLQMD